MSTDITFCTNMVNAGIDLKSLQYLMGHSDVKVTLDVYSHINYQQKMENPWPKRGFVKHSKNRRQEL